MAMSNISTEFSGVNTKIEDLRCSRCQQSNCDVQIIGCGCLLHTTCLPLDILCDKISSRACVNPYYSPLCPACQSAPIQEIQVLPLPIQVLEKASHLKQKDVDLQNFQNYESSLDEACGSPTNRDVECGAGKRSFASRNSVSRSYRTGRWASEESTYVDKLIKVFDAGWLAVPHGIKLNDFLCELLCCRTSRLTKKLKNAKLSTRSYRSMRIGDNSQASVNAMLDLTLQNFGSIIQRVQALFLKTINPEWVRMELRFNMSRLWRTHLVNFCLQIGYLKLETKNWFSSLDAADYVTSSCDDESLQAKRKRMKTALSEDAFVASKSIPYGNPDVGATTRDSPPGEARPNEGVFVGGLPFKRFSELSLVNMCEDEQNENQPRSRSGSLANSIMYKRGSSADLSQFENTMKHSPSLASFAELFCPDNDVWATRRSSRADSFSSVAGARSSSAPDGCKNEERPPSSFVETKGSDAFIDDAVDSVLNSSPLDQDCQGRFLLAVCKFLSDLNSPFQHVDLWVPMASSPSDSMGSDSAGGSPTRTTTSTCGKVNGVKYGSQVTPTVRLSHAGFVSIPRSAPSYVLSRLNEFGTYSKNFSFSLGFGMPGRVAASGIQAWESNITATQSDHFARVGGAKIYGVNTVVGIPVYTPIGNMVVGLYSVSCLPRSVTWENKCIEYFKKLKPEPKWTLTIDIGSRQDGNSLQRIVPEAKKPAMFYNSHEIREVKSPESASDSRTACVIPPSPVAVSTTPTPSPNLKPRSNSPSQLAQNFSKAMNSSEKSLAMLLGKYMPMGSNTDASNSDLSESLTSLRLSLLKHSSCRGGFEAHVVAVIMDRYQSYVNANYREHNLILLLLKDWKSLVSSLPGHANTKVVPPPTVSNPSSSNASHYLQPQAVLAPSNSYGNEGNMPPPEGGTEVNFDLPSAFTQGTPSNEQSNSSGSSQTHSPIQNHTSSNNPAMARVVSEQGPIETKN